MSREKQIEEMAKICHFYDDGICHLCEELLVSCDRKCDLVILVENLYTAGYRKATDVAREIIADLVKFADDKERQMSFHNHSVWYIYADDVTDFIAELKKKYTERSEQ